MAVTRASKPRLVVSSAGQIHYILVPPAHAQDLRSYLSKSGIPSSPPEPQSADTDSVGLHRKADIASVERLLKSWAAS